MGVYIVELEKPMPFTDECRMSVLNTIKRYRHGADTVQARIDYICESEYFIYLKVTIEYVGDLPDLLYWIAVDSGCYGYEPRNFFSVYKLM